MKSVEDTSETLTKQVCTSLSALGAVQAGYVLAHTPSPATMRIVKHFKDQVCEVRTDYYRASDLSYGFPSENSFMLRDVPCWIGGC